MWPLRTSSKLGRVLATAAVGVAVFAHGGCSRKSDVPSAVPRRAPSEQALRERLDAARLAKGPGYTPRTRHKNADGTPRYTNRLILESSPYLLQHAHNPVDWYAWGEEAFARARATGRPIFLSIGYSTCHWCHVMEEESFEDEDIAAYINEHYVAIKVDREQRPDIDAVYMRFVEALTGGGGWPLSAWLTPGREPFFGGTYFPPRAGVHGARRGFIDVLREQAERFRANPTAVVADARSYATQLRASAAPEPAGDFPSAASVAAAVAAAKARFDPAWGGLRGAPKFPSSFPTALLLRYARRARDPEAQRMAVETLAHLQAGGIRDQIGGGFHRYATDAHWLVPHFEQMLYDNALLAAAYLEGFEVTGRADFADTARGTLDYLLREMQAPDGTFYGATDADSLTRAGNKEEGAFFTWTPRELDAALGAPAARVASAWFGVASSGNLDGRTVLSTPRSWGDVARELSLEPTELESRVSAIRDKLLGVRRERPPPDRDEKVIVSWNALAVTALARAALTLGDERYRDAATRAAAKLVSELGAQRPLPHVFIGGKPEGAGFSDDYALLAAALLDLFELTSESAWLSAAAALMDDLESRFRDPTSGGYFLSENRGEALLTREKPDDDGPLPSANSVAALTWLRLYELSGDPRYRECAETTLRAFEHLLVSRPLSLERMRLAVDWASDAVKEIAVVVPAGRGVFAPSARPLLAVLGRSFVPNSVLVVASASDFAGELGRRVPWASGKTLRGERATAYVCERGACKLPTSDPRIFEQELAAARTYP